MHVLPVAAGEKVGTRKFYLYFHLYLMIRRVILHYNSQKQIDALNSSHENQSKDSADADPTFQDPHTSEGYRSITD